MPIDKGSVDGSIHSHTGNCHLELSGKYAEYIEEHRVALMSKCERVNDCIEGLLKDENVLLLLKGDNLSLNKTCGLIYGNHLKDDQFGSCKSEDREDIRDDLEQHLVLQFEDVKSSGWKNVNKCLSSMYGDNERTTYVNDICRLAKNQTLICDNRNVHKNVTTFFNNQIQHLQCTCRSLYKNEHIKPINKRDAFYGGRTETFDLYHGQSPTKDTENFKDEGGQGSKTSPALIGGLIGGLFLLLLIIFAVLFIFYRRRKSQKRNKNVIYLPAPNSDCPVYQEVFDENFPGYGKYPSGNPPTLPMRFNKPQTGTDEEPTYLEPVEAGMRFRPQMPCPGRSNPHYGAPPEYSERDTDENAVAPADKENGYFEPLLNPEDLAVANKTSTENTSGYETIAAVLPSEEDTPKPEGVVRVPTPAKRTRIERDEDGEPRYVTLEKEPGVKRMNSIV